LREMAAKGFLIVVLAISLLLAVSGGGKSKPRTEKRHKRMEFCVQDPATFHVNNDTLREQALDKIKALGATCIRHMLHLQRLDPCGVNYLHHLRRYHHLVDAANVRKLKVEFVITGSATQWGAAIGKDGKPCGAPKGINPKPADLKKFIAKYVPIFTAKNVTRYSIWNEPNAHAWLCNGVVKQYANGTVKCTGSTLESQAKAYRALYIAAWNEFQRLKKVKKIPNSTQVILGEVVGPIEGLKFLRLVTRGKNGLIAHGISVHPTQYCFAPNTRKFVFPINTCKLKQEGGIGWANAYVKLSESLRKQKRLRTPKKAAAPVLFTEFAYMKTGPHQISDELRAKWYPKAMSFAKRKGIAQMSIYQLTPRDKDAGWDSSLLNKDGSPGPSYIALQVWARQNQLLNRTRIVKPVKNSA